MEWNILNKANNSKEVMQNIVKYKNMSKEDILNFIKFNISKHSPELLTNLDKAINRIIKAILNKETITIIGDYDVDGICSTMVLYLTLKDLTNTRYIIPNRFTDGYGINNNLIDRAKEYNTSLIITVDNGINAYDQVLYCKSLNMDIIITDHHAYENNYLPTEITINPNIDNNYPFKEICGCMVAYKLAYELIKNSSFLFSNINIDNLLRELKEFVCLATIADVMPLVDENRIYVKEGIDLLKNGSINIGLNALINQLNIKNISTNDISFYISPCINAAGRLETPDIVMNLFNYEDIVECNKLANYLIELNNERKSIQKNILDNLTINRDDDFLVVHVEQSIPGIVGIIAGNISEKYKKPCFCLCGKETLHGSGRSVGNYPINRIILNNQDFLSGGGHKGACGIKLNIKDLDRLRKVCNEDFKEYLSNNKNIFSSIDIINEINFDIIDKRLINNIDKLSPFGYGNEYPLFCTKDVIIDSYKIVGKNHNVIQLNLKQNNITFKAIGFNNIIDKIDKLNKNIVDIVYTLSLNEWPVGNINIQLIINDIK